jgi:hypothetical protein
MVWNRSKTGKSFLLYAEVIEEEDKAEGMDVGIGQKVTNLGEKINKKTERSIKSAKKEIMKAV